MFTGLRVQLKNRLCKKNPVNNEKAWSLASRFFIIYGMSKKKPTLRRLHAAFAP